MKLKRPQTLENRVDHLKRLINLLTNLSTRQDYLAADKDEKDDLWLHHSVDETGEQLGLVRAEVHMTGRKTLQTNGKLDVARSNDVLDLEVSELGVESEFLDDTSIFARSKLRVVLRLGTSDNHLARGKDEGRGFWLTNAHDDSRKTLGELAQYFCRRPRVSSTLGLYSALRAWRAIVLRSKRQSRLTVATMFLDVRMSLMNQKSPRVIHTAR